MQERNKCPLCGGKPKEILYGIPMIQFKEPDARWYYAESAFHGNLFIDDLEKWAQQKDIDSRTMYTVTGIECEDCGAMTLPTPGLLNADDVWNKGYVIKRFGPTDGIRVTVPESFLAFRKKLQELSEEEG